MLSQSSNLQVNSVGDVDVVILPVAEHDENIVDLVTYQTLGRQIRVEQGHFGRWKYSVERGLPGGPMIRMIDIIRRGEKVGRVQANDRLRFMLPNEPDEVLTQLKGRLQEAVMIAKIDALCANHFGGGRLLWYCLKLLKEKGVVHATAWGMYKYSLAYLFLLFIAMGVDRVFPVGRLSLTPPPEVFILGGELQRIPLEQVTGEHGDH